MELAVRVLWLDLLNALMVWQVFHFMDSVLLPKLRKTEEYQHMLRILEADRLTNATETAAVKQLKRSGTMTEKSSTGRSSPLSRHFPLGGPSGGRIEPHDAHIHSTGPPVSPRKDGSHKYTLKEILQSSTGCKFFKEFLISR